VNWGRGLRYRILQLTINKELGTRISKGFQGFQGFQNKMIITINIVSDLNKILKKDKIENESQKRKNRNLS